MDKNLIKQVFLSNEEIEKINKKLASQIELSYKGKTPIFIGILKGCLPFLSDLLKNITTIPTQIDYMMVSSYKGSTGNRFDTNIILDLQTDITNRDIIIVEDIVDTGLTLEAIIKELSLRNPSSIAIVTLLDKPEGRKTTLVPSFIGKTIPNKFVFGYGLDIAENFRNLNFIAELDIDYYTNIYTIKHKKGN